MQPADLQFGEDGLLTVVAQDRLTGEIRMLAHANLDAVAATLRTGRAHFYSRSRRALWCKGESSGHFLNVHEVWGDCDGDALVYLVDPVGPSCHTGRNTCFFRVVGDQSSAEDEGRYAQALLPRLWAELEGRARGDAKNSYTKRLLDAGTSTIGDKIREEAAELAAALQAEGAERVAAEAADEIYHLLVGLLSRGVSLRTVEAELARRLGTSGLAEKAARTTPRSRTR